MNPFPSTVSFHGHALTSVEQNGTIYVAIKPITEAIGLSWASQVQKIARNRDKFGCVDIDIPSKGGPQKTICIPLRKLNGWLFSINAEKVRPDIRDTVRLYQEECFTVLHDYWHHGTAVNPRQEITPATTAHDISSILKTFHEEFIALREERNQLKAELRRRTDQEEALVAKIHSDPDFTLIPIPFIPEWGGSCFLRGKPFLFLSKGPVDTTISPNPIRFGGNSFPARI